MKSLLQKDKDIGYKKNEALWRSFPGKWVDEPEEEYFIDPRTELNCLIKRED
jgi:hypothetical protein